MLQIHDETDQRSPGAYNGNHVRAWSPYIIIALFLLISRIPWFRVKPLISSRGITFPAFFGIADRYRLKWAYLPGILPFMATAILTAFINRTPRRAVKKAWEDSFHQVSGAAVSGRAYPMVAPFIGVLGAFMSGSNTVSNILFSSLQFETATRYPPSGNTGISVSKEVQP